MKRYAFAIQKGGTGKSSISTNVAFALSQMGKKICFIDNDPQGNASTLFLGNKLETREKELADLLKGSADFEEVLCEINENLFLLPTFGKNGSLKQYSEKGMTLYQYDDLLNAIDKHFDIAILDLSPGTGLLEQYALIGVDEVLTPLLPEPFSLDGIGIFQTFIEQVMNNYRTKIKHNKIIINNYNSSMTVHNDIREALKKNEGYLFFEVPQSTDFKYSQAENKSLFEYKPKSKAIPVIMEIAEAIS